MYFSEQSKKRKRMQRLKDRKMAKKLIKTEMESSEDEMFVPEAIPFGEVVQAPPKLKKIMKKQASTQQVLSFIPKSAKPAEVPNFGKGVTPARQKVLEEERALAVAQYRKLKLMKFFNKGAQ